MKMKWSATMKTWGAIGKGHMIENTDMRAAPYTVRRATWAARLVLMGALLPAWIWATRGSAADPASAAGNIPASGSAPDAAPHDPALAGCFAVFTAPRCALPQSDHFVIRALTLSVMLPVLLLLANPNSVEAAGSSRPAVPSWQIQPSANPSQYDNYLLAADGTSTNVWAVGRTEGSGSPNIHSLIERLTANGWVQVPSPSPGTSATYLNSVAALADDNAWAVGYSLNNNGPSQTVTMHWDGASWNLVPSPNAGPSSALRSVGGRGANDIWAVGSADPNGTYLNIAMHWDGASWSMTPTPQPGSLSQLFAVTSLGPDDAWAAGQSTDSSGGGHPLTMHWDGSAWNVVPTPDGPGGGVLWSIKAFSGSDIWVVGEDYPCIPCEATLVEHWNGTAWTIVPSANVNPHASWLYSVRGISSQDLWAVGGTTPVNAGTVQPMIIHWDGKTWSSVPVQPRGPSDSTLFGLVILPQASPMAHACAPSNCSALWDGYAVGDSYTPNVGNQTLVETTVPPRTAPRRSK